MQATKFEMETLDLEGETRDLDPVSITCFDAILVDEGTCYLEPYETELWWRQSDLLTVLRTVAPAGEYEIWSHSGPESSYADWREGKYETGWESKPILRAVKLDNGELETRPVESERERLMKQMTTSELMALLRKAL